MTEVKVPLNIYTQQLSVGDVLTVTDIDPQKEIVTLSVASANSPAPLPVFKGAETVLKGAGMAAKGLANMPLEVLGRLIKDKSENK